MMALIARVGLIVTVSIGLALSGCAHRHQESHLSREAGHWDTCRLLEDDKGGMIDVTWQSPLNPEAKLSHPVFLCGKNNQHPVLLLHELPGLSQATMAYAAELADHGFKVYVPLLFGDLYQFDPMAGIKSYLCDGEWCKRSDLQGSTYITQWLKTLVKQIAKENHGQSIGVIGNCMTGALPLALLDEASVKGVVLAQPTLPLRTYFFLGGATQLEISPSEWSQALRRLNPKASGNADCGECRPTAKAYATRFELDRKAPREKYCYLKRHLGEGFIGREISKQEYVYAVDGSNIRSVSDSAHSSLIADWEKYENHPSQIRRREIEAFLRAPLDYQPSQLADDPWNTNKRPESACPDLD